MQVKNLTYVDEKGVRRFSDISFEVRAGEIVGIAGVAGNGQSELLEVLAGIRHATSGEIILHGEHIPAAMRTRSGDAAQERPRARARGSPPHGARDGVRGMGELRARLSRRPELS